MVRMTLASLAMLVGSAASAQPADERVVIAPTPGFVVGYTAARDGQMIEERVPSGETVQDWTAMVTIQRFPQPADNVDAVAFLELLRANWQRACPNARAGAATTVRIAQREGSALRADCPLNPATGKPETMFARAVIGAAYLHVVQVAYRSAPTAKQADWSTALLGSIRLCRGTDCS